MREVYLDNAATMTKIPKAVKAEADFYRTINANPLRGLYKKSVQATTEVEACRKKLLRLVNADKSDTVIFSRGTTEAINMVASGLLLGEDGFGVVSKDAKVVVDIYSHHSNILPWKQRYKNVILSHKFKDGEIKGAKIFALTGVSNVTGGNLASQAKWVRESHPEAIIGLDAAQMVCHEPIDMKALGADFMAFSGHKFGAPMGIGGLIIKKELAEKLRPLNFGGEMVDSVSVSGEPVFSEIPGRLEGGTLPVGAIFGLSKALDFWLEKDIKKEKARVSELREEASNKIMWIPGVRVLASNGAILTFQVEGVHPHDAAQVLADEGIAVRAGYLCAQPYLDFCGFGPVVRASFSIFNTEEEVSYFVEAVSKIREKMGLKDV